MRCVKLTLPSPDRERYPLITLRLTSSSLAGMLRKLVAVGTSRLCSMFLTMTAPTPLISSPGSGACASDAVGVGVGVAIGVAIGAATAVSAAGAGSGWAAAVIDR